MFVKDRQHEKHSRRQQIIYRMQADAVVGDENLYKIEYVGDILSSFGVLFIGTELIPALSIRSRMNKR